MSFSCSVTVGQRRKQLAASACSTGSAAQWPNGCRSDPLDQRHYGEQVQFFAGFGPADRVWFGCGRDAGLAGFGRYLFSVTGSFE